MRSEGKRTGETHYVLGKSWAGAAWIFASTYSTISRECCHLAVSLIGRDPDIEEVIPASLLPTPSYDPACGRVDHLSLLQSLSRRDTVSAVAIREGFVDTAYGRHQLPGFLMGCEPDREEVVLSIREHDAVLAVTCRPFCIKGVVLLARPTGGPVLEGAEDHVGFPFGSRTILTPSHVGGIAQRWG